MRPIPAREAMTRLEGDESRETRAAVVGGRLLILVFERYDVAAGSDWERDREAGVVLGPDALAALRTLLASTDCDECGEAPATVGRKCRDCDINGGVEATVNFEEDKPTT